MKFEKWHSLVEKELREKYYKEYPPIINVFQAFDYFSHYDYIKPKEAAQMIANNYINELENFEVINGYRTY